MTGKSMTGASAVLRRTAAAGLIMALAWGLTSCADDGAGAEEPTAGASADPSATSASASPASTPTPTPTPSAAYSPASAAGPAQNVPLPVMPDIAREKSKEGLEAFARYFYEVVNYAYETGDLAPLDAISGPDCVACNFARNQIGVGYEGDDWIVGGQLDIKAVVSEFVETPEGLYQALADLKQEDIKFHSPNGLLQTNPGTPTSFAQLFEGRYADGRWSAEDVVSLGR
ncbi:hypothetical protein BN1051_02559 [Arthrobacter saudimassiliensis]|uniref:DUF6318 domain-containing protein n=1 Tax=Arthrobacter saudimassiliensis TaxID=1461584 RepID=A0A078MUS2_9MICC|nr:hypothetical protein BN1051_02559 [Arthrobacter saudimassiliensis]